MSPNAHATAISYLHLLPNSAHPRSLTRVVDKKKFCILAIRNAPSEDSDQTARLFRRFGSYWDHPNSHLPLSITKL